MWKEVIIEEESRSLNSENDINKLETLLKVRFSKDHHHFLQEYGEGVLFNHYRIYGVEKIINERKEFQKRWTEYFHWTSKNSVLTKSDLENAIIIGDTFNSDEIVIVPNKPEEYFYLSADEDCIISLGKGLEKSISKLVENLKKEIETYDEEEREEWDIRPVFNCEDF